MTVLVEQQEERHYRNIDNNRMCPVCLRDEDVRISGKKGQTTQYLCKFCHTYFIPSTVNNQRKKIWHDKIFWKRVRLINKYLMVKSSQY